jgi:hypothetical protein
VLHFTDIVIMLSNGESEVLVGLVNLYGVVSGKTIAFFGYALLTIIIAPAFDLLTGLKTTPRPRHLYLELCSAIFLVNLWVVAYKVSNGHSFVKYLMNLVVFSASYGNALIHELIHFHPQSNRYKIGRALHSILLFDGYHRRHLKSHHIIVATKEDQETARRGQTVYEYVLQGYWNHYFVQEFDAIVKNPTLLWGYSFGLSNLLSMWLLFGPWSAMIFLLNMPLATLLFVLSAYP